LEHQTVIEACERLRQLDIRSTPGEDRDTRRGLNRPWLPGGEVGDAPRDARTAVDLGNAGQGLGEFGGEQREVGAGEHHHVHVVTGQRSNCGGNGDRVDALTRQLGLGERDQLGRAVAEHHAVGGEARGEIVDIGLANGGLRPEHANDAGPALLGGGLDRGNGADHRNVERGADERQGNGRGGVTGDHR
jgi:hypothetical protein